MAKTKAVPFMEESLGKAVTLLIQAKAELYLKNKGTANGMLEFAYGIAEKYQMDETEAKRMLGLDKKGK